MHAISGRRMMLRDDLAADQDARHVEAEALAHAWLAPIRWPRFEVSASSVV